MLILLELRLFGGNLSTSNCSFKTHLDDVRINYSNERSQHRKSTRNLMLCMFRHQLVPFLQFVINFRPWHRNIWRHKWSVILNVWLHKLIRKSSLWARYVSDSCWSLNAFRGLFLGPCFPLSFTLSRRPNHSSWILNHPLLKPGKWI